MKMAKHQRWLLGAACVALTACSNMDSNHDSASINDDGSSSNSTASAASSPGSSDTTRSYASTPASSSTAHVSYGTVQSVDPMQRQDIAVGTLGAAAAGGSMGAPTDRVYRVAVRMDDGTIQTMVVDNKPGYKSGDRIRYTDGTLEKY